MIQFLVKKHTPSIVDGSTYVTGDVISANWQGIWDAPAIDSDCVLISVFDGNRADLEFVLEPLQDKTVTVEDGFPLPTIGVRRYYFDTNKATSEELTELMELKSITISYIRFLEVVTDRENG